MGYESRLLPQLERNGGPYGIDRRENIRLPDSWTGGYRLSDGKHEQYDGGSTDAKHKGQCQVNDVLHDLSAACSVGVRQIGRAGISATHGSSFHVVYLLSVV